MELYIKIKDGQPHEHPMLGDNVRQAFPEIDTTNLPSNFARFVRVEIPEIGTYEVYEGVTYEQSGDVFTDVHHVRQMTQEEKTAKQDAVKAEWALYGDPLGVWDEEKCTFIVPPIFVSNPIPYSERENS
jgi:hypothetical protein